MPSIESRKLIIYKELCSKTSHATAYVASTDWQFAFSQLNLHPNTARHFNVRIVSANMSCTHSFKTVFYGLTNIMATL